MSLDGLPLRSTKAVFSVILALVATGLSQQTRSPLSAPTRSTSKYARDRILVKFRPGISGTAKASIHANFGTHTIRKFSSLQDL